MNVKSPFQGHRLKDAMQEPVQSIDGHQLTFLDGTVDWPDAWKSTDLSSGSMTTETHTALRLALSLSSSQNTVWENSSSSTLS